MVHLLALDTSTPAAALAVGTAAGTVYGAAPDPAERHGRNLVPAIGALLESAGVAIGEVGGIAVGLGPGSYTGLRIGVTAAKVLAYTLGVPLVGLDSLEVVARNAPPHARRVAVIADAQRGEVYAADFARPSDDAPLDRLGATRIERLEDWLGGLPEGTFVLGSALDRLRAPLPAGAARGDSASGRPEPANLLALARETWATGRRDDPWQLEPLYLRRSAAEEQWDKRSRP